jgi:hypothetical protein
MKKKDSILIDTTQMPIEIRETSQNTPKNIEKIKITRELFEQRILFQERPFYQPII